MSFRRLSLCCTLFSFSALHAVTWLAPVNLDPNGACMPQIVGNSQGDVRAVWTHIDNRNVSVQASQMIDGLWSPAVSLSPEKQDGIVSAVMDTKGNAVAIWRAEGTAYAATTSPQNSWSTPVELSSASEGMMIPPQVATDNQGNFLAIWASQTDSGIVVESARLTAGESVWTPLYAFTTSYMDYLRLGMDASGNAIVAWDENNAINVSFLKAGTKSWTNSQTLSTTQSTGPVLSVDQDGNAIVAWFSFSDSSLQASTYKKSTGQWTPTQSPGEARIWQDVLQVTYLPDGTAAAIWSSQEGAVQTATLSRFSTSWSTVESLTDQRQNLATLQLSVSAEGNLLAAWYNNSQGLIQAAIGTKNGWSSALTVTGDYWPEVSKPLIGSQNQAILLFSDNGGVQSITGKDLFSLSEES